MNNLFQYINHFFTFISVANVLLCVDLFVQCSNFRGTVEVLLSYNFTTRRVLVPTSLPLCWLLLLVLG